MKKKPRLQNKHLHLGKCIFKLFISALRFISEAFPPKAAKAFAIKLLLLCDEEITLSEFSWTQPALCKDTVEPS